MLIIALPLQSFSLKHVGDDFTVFCDPYVGVVILVDRSISCISAGWFSRISCFPTVFLCAHLFQFLEWIAFSLSGRVVKTQKVALNVNALSEPLGLCKLITY